MSRARLLSATFLVWALCAVSIGLPSAFAQEPTTAGFERPPHKHDRGHRGGPPPLERTLARHAERLGLDDETEARIDEIVTASRAQLDALHAEVRSLHDDMRTLLSQDHPSEEAVLVQAEAIGKAETAIHKERLRAMLRIRDLLTPDQRAELVRIRDEERSERGQRGGWHGHRGGPPPPAGTPPPPSGDWPPPPGDWPPEGGRPPAPEQPE